MFQFWTPLVLLVRAKQRKMREKGEGERKEEKKMEGTEEDERERRGREERERECVMS